MNELPVKGDRVRMVGIMPEDPDPIPVGSEGTVLWASTSSLGTQITVDWDNGRKLNLLENDPYIIL